jgi:hypothetical protein
MIGKAITTIINANAAIIAIIGNNLYPLSDYDKGIPAIYYVVKALPDYTKGTVTMTKWQFTLLTHCKTYLASWQLALQLKQLFDLQQQQTNAGIKFTHIKCNSITDDYEFTINNYGQVLEFSVTTPNIQV